MDLRFLCVAVLTGTVAASYRSTQFSDCSEYCEISDVSFDPCHNTERCTLRTGSRASLAIDFTPRFYARRLKAAVYVWWFFMYFKAAEIPVVCQHTSCPVYKGDSRQLSFDWVIDKSQSTGNYHLKVEIWDEDDDSRDCCFKTQVELI